MSKNTGRPSKLTNNFIKAAEEVLNEWINAIIFTDDELLFAINEKLKPKEQISERTFKVYKKYAKNKDAQEELNNFDIGVLNRFLHLYKKALQNQKKHLFEAMRNEEKAWQKYAWIIERKFSDWNLKQISEVKQETEHNLYIKEEAKQFLDELE